MIKKKVVLAALLFTASALFTSCANPNNLPADDKLSVVATIFPQYDFAKQIGGGKIKLKMLTAPGGESHSYEPTPQDIKAVRDCDIFICAGGESDVWYNTVLKSLDLEGVTVISLMECVEDRLKEEEITEGMRGEKYSLTGSADEEETEYDEHVWTSLKNAQIITQKISDTMCLLDEKNASLYKENTESYIKSLGDLEKKYQAAAGKAEKKTLVFGDRFPFRYLFDDCGLNYYAAFPGCSADSDVSAKTMLFLINKVREEELPAVYYIEFSARRIADTIAEETGAEPMLFHSCHTVSKQELENGTTYLSLMEQNLENLKRGLNVETD